MKTYARDRRAGGERIFGEMKKPHHRNTLILSAEIPCGRAEVQNRKCQYHTIVWECEII